MNYFLCLFSHLMVQCTKEHKKTSQTLYFPSHSLPHRALQDQVLSIGTGTQKYPHMVPHMRLGPGTLFLEFRCCDRDPEWILVSPTNETGMGSYLIPGLSKVPGIFHWSRKWDQEREFYFSGPLNGKETGNVISPVPLYRPGWDHT